LICQEETEQVHLRVLVQALEEVLEWVDHEGEERVAPEQVQAQQGSVFVPNAELSHLMRLEFLALLSNVPNVGQRW
jgi:hypothetical protein